MELTTNPGGQPSFKGFCDHCNNTTFQTILIAEHGLVENKARTYSLSKCTICDGVVLREHEGYVRKQLLSPPRTDLNFHQIWPPSASLSSDVPQRVLGIYEEARLIKRKSPSSFVVQLRRAFEAVAKDRQAEGHDLNAQIRSMIDQGKLPSVFGEMMHISRMIGNAGAHDAEEVTSEDADVADQFFVAIIEYLYVAPAFVAKVKNARAKPKDEEGNM